MRILIYGAGVIGCLYAVLFHKAGYDVTIYARGKKLELLKKGLLYEANGKIEKLNIRIIEQLQTNDLYDYIFLTVKENQIHQALFELSFNETKNIVTMVNTLEDYSIWEKLCGKGRIIPAFPGAGGSFDGDVLKAKLTPWLIQPTTYSEINGVETERIQKLTSIFKTAKIPCQIVKDMHTWQLCHLGMVVPIADAYYMAKNPKTTWKEVKVMHACAKQLKTNFQALYHLGVNLSPKKMHIFRLLPVWVLRIGLIITFKSDFGNLFMYQHAMKAPDEMKQLHHQFYQYLEIMQRNSKKYRKVSNDGSKS